MPWVSVWCPSCGGSTRTLRTFPGLACKREKKCNSCGHESTTWELNEGDAPEELLVRLKALLTRVERAEAKIERQRDRVRVTNKKETQG